MPPIPCAHCGHNFMRTTLDPEAPKLCNNCIVREGNRQQKKEDKMDTVDILIKCPKDIQIEIEELCINVGIDFTKYFLQLHKENMQLKYDLMNPPNGDVLLETTPPSKPDFMIHKKALEKDLPKKNKGLKK